MALSADSRARITRRWAERLGCAPDALREPGITTVESTTPRTIRILRRRDAVVVALPENAEGTSIETVHGPYVLAYVDKSSFSPIESVARILDVDDEAAFAALRERVPDADWRRASPTFRAGRTAGQFHDGALVAAATLSSDEIPDIAVVVDPEHRGRGHGRAVVSAITSTALREDPEAILRYRTPASSSASLALAASLGYERWAASAVLTLDQAGPP